ncbi:squalene synthetase-like protein [Friedmanniomyces endolithicus]|uniref:Squalene synthetase-like protein n=1 Tax=Friedmanniomyces endolithicus TaxID=329885 RepID=A0AAN6J382_9PEZI|nr:squalene synthetase-like protein [Friedmanniomyces endolithicus]
MGKKGKSKQPTGRAKQRQKNPTYAAFGNVGQSPRFLVDDTDDNAQRSFRGFSQGSPQRGFPHGGPRGDFSQSGPNVKLRHQNIAFVSAGNSTPVKLESTEMEREIRVAAPDEDMESGTGELEELGEGEVDESGTQTNVVMDTDAELPEAAIGRMNIQDPSSSKDLFFVDTTGDPTLASTPAVKGKQRARRSPSLARSDISDEVVVFHGRSKPAVPTSKSSAPKASAPPKTVVSRPAAPPTSASPAFDTPTEPAPSHPSQDPDLLDDLLTALNGPGEPVASSFTAKGWAAKPSKFDRQAASAANGTWQAAPATPYWRKGKPRPDPNSQTSDTVLQGDSRMLPRPDMGKGAEESITELQADWKSVLREKRVSKSSPGDLEVLHVSEKPKQPSRKGKRGRKQSNRQLRVGTLSDADDDDDEAAYDDYMANLAAQLNAEDSQPSTLTPSTTHLEAGPSLVVNGKEVAEDEVLKHDTEQDWEDENSDSDSSNDPIGQDLSELSNADGPAKLSDLGSSDLEEELEYTEREQWEDEEDLRQRRQDAMTDEHIARLFAKQQELGIDSEDIVIDDGVFDATDGVGDLDAARAGLHEITNSAFARATPTRPKRSPRAKGSLTFPDASALADTVEQYGVDGFDIMDFDRPSLRPTKKGRKAQPLPGLDALSDDELKAVMLSAWDHDRAKKRAKKAEREDLRSQGLLGSAAKKTGKADLAQKYLQGMTMGQVREELTIFLQDDGMKSRAFPPMAKKERADLHLIADALGLKSKSVGSGHSRFPVLYKTGITVAYSEATLGRIISSAERGFLKNSRGKGKGGKVGKGPGGPGGGGGRARGGGFDKASTGLRNGEVVGGGARELGRENFGHRLMEKMGWMAGTALGKDGEGLLVPVAQVMRSGKAGLG